MTWAVKVVVWFVTGATRFAFSRWLVAHSSRDSQQDGRQAPAWLERHQRLHTHASLATKRQSIDGSRKVVRKETLKLHLSPHFMFNALSSVQWLWGEGRIEEAKQVFPSFVSLWRAHWREEGDRVHSLRAEFDTLEQYVRLEEIRLGCVVQWNVRCENRAWLDTLIPSLVTQPAVKNAIWHGFGGHEGPLAIEISVSPSLEALAPGWLDIRHSWQRQWIKREGQFSQPQLRGHGGHPQQIEGTPSRRTHRHATCSDVVEHRSDFFASPRSLKFVSWRG